MQPGAEVNRVGWISTLGAAGLVALAATLATTPAQAAPKVEDSIAQRVLACTGCHGAQGRAARDGYYPRIAGKPAGYLYNQLLSFRDGRRHYAPMATLLAPLTDDYLREIATHFASLDLPYPAPQPATASVAGLALGQRLVTQGDGARRIPACVACHGEALTGVMPAIPSLIGMPRDYLHGQLGAWQTSNRRAAAPDCMAQIAKVLTPDDIGAISQWLAGQPVPLHAHAAAALPAAMPIACGSAKP